MDVLIDVFGALNGGISCRRSYGFLGYVIPSAGSYFKLHRLADFIRIRGFRSIIGGHGSHGLAARRHFHDAPRLAYRQLFGYSLALRYRACRSIQSVRPLVGLASACRLRFGTKVCRGFRDFVDMLVDGPLAVVPKLYAGYLGEGLHFHVK